MNRRLSSLALALVVLAAAGGCRNAAGASGRLLGTVVAGPSCPVVTDPPMSGCEARPVGGATLVIVDESGDRVASVTTGDDGHFQLNLAPGPYEVQPQPVDGLLGTAPPVSVTVTAEEPARVTVSYDTGIR